ncbi:N-acetylmuramoyl-L-alanine amidase [Aureispira anguillae]|uniref:N-acetylmuramoyl-L-alanine amidase n=1 Tax=Aureispira anguillae TaxID=2864201 RepID=A0A915YFU7_9BACT|nr:N-acetylmuramoyl-L-alanine amidase [Aureispira anguillae]BDS12380.1 N-acetylmuramoyl-L-alanine amidase [Aureispira anguillae]
MYPIPIISNGHGGMIGSIYQTKGKRSPIWSDGAVLYEGECNRAIKNRVIELLHFKGIPYYDLVPEQHDLNRKTRVARANRFHRQHKKTFLIDLHSNAGGGEGSEVFVAHNASSSSLSLAAWTKFLFIRHFPESTFRGIKRENYDLLHLTAMPAILLENFFMDTELECRTYLMTPKGRDRIAAYVVAIIEAYIKFHS